MGPRKTDASARKSNIDALNLKDDDLILGSEDERRNKENNDKLKDILQQAVEGPSDERKEKLKIKLLNESQIYYQNNMNIFCNGLSLLTVNSLEVHGMVHQVESQAEQIKDLAVNIEAHTSFMKDKTAQMVERLQKIQEAM